MDDGNDFQKTLEPRVKKRGKEYTPPRELLTQDDERRFADLEAQDDLCATKPALEGQNCELFALEPPAIFR